MKALLYRNFVILVYVLLLPLAGFAQRAGDLDYNFNYFKVNNFEFRQGEGARSISLVIQQPDDKIIAIGEFETYNDTFCRNIVRLNIDGTIDPSFKTDVDFIKQISTAALQKDGKIIIIGDFRKYDKEEFEEIQYQIARLNSDGSLDTNFKPQLFYDSKESFANVLAIQNDGRILLGCSIRSNVGDDKSIIYRINSNGTVDSSFNLRIGLDDFSSYDRIGSIIIQPDEKIIVTGAFTKKLGISRNYIVRLNTDGSIDRSFEIGSGIIDSKSIEYPMALQSNGKILITGTLKSNYGTSNSFIARLNTNGKVDKLFKVGKLQYEVKTIIVQSDGKILIGGGFYKYNGIPIFYLARLNEDGTLDNSFIMNVKLNNVINSLALQTDGKIIIAGEFSNYNTPYPDGICRVWGRTITKIKQKNSH